MTFGFCVMTGSMPSFYPPLGWFTSSIRSSPPDDQTHLPWPPRRSPFSCDAKSSKRSMFSPGGPGTALRVWGCRATRGLTSERRQRESGFFPSLLFLRHPDTLSDVWATPPPRHPARMNPKF